MGPSWRDQCVSWIAEIRFCNESVVATPRSRGGNLGTRGHDVRHLLHVHVIVCASVYEFRGQNSIKGGRM